MNYYPDPSLVRVYETSHGGGWTAVVAGIISDGFTSEIDAWKWAAHRAAQDACQAIEMLEEALSDGH